MNYRISTVIPCYNHARLLPRAVESALHGVPGLEREVIVVDDGSTDNTAAVCAELVSRHTQVRIIRQKNSGLSNARNTGIRAATGDLVHFLDADDYVEPAMYLEIARAFEQNPAAGVAYCGFKVIDPAGGQSWESQEEVAPADMRERLLRGNIGPVHSIVVKREAVDAVGFFDETLTSCEDWDYWLRIALKGFAFVRVPGVFACYERQASSMSRNYPVMVKNAKALLAKASANASNVKVDRKALRVMRRGLFDASYAGMMEGYLSAGRFGFVIRETLRVVRADPASGWLMLSLLSHHKRATARGMGTMLSRLLGAARGRAAR